MNKNDNDSRFPYEGQVAVSYARCSTTKQTDSTDRQIEEGLKYIAEQKMELNESLSFTDEGVSAWHGKNYSSEGNLGKFLDVVKQGEFPNGVHLVVESLDRMYRSQPRKAMNHLAEMVEDYNVTVHTLMDGQVYKPNDFDGENMMTTLLISIVRLVAAHDYSKKLADRVKLSVVRRREKMEEQQEFLHIGNIPCFLQVVKFDTKPPSYDLEVKFKEEGKRTIRKIFEMCVDGFSAAMIANDLSEKEIQCFTDSGWSKDLVISIIHSKWVIGYKPQTEKQYLKNKKTGKEQIVHKTIGIEKIYSKELPIIEEELFYAAQDAMASRTHTGKKGKRKINIFSGLFKCGYCKIEKKSGAKVLLKDDGTPEMVSSMMEYVTRDKKGNEIDFKPMLRTLMCLGAKKGQKKVGKCHGFSVNYAIIQDALLSFMQELDFSKLIDSKDKTELKQNQFELDSMKGKLAEVEGRIANFNDAIGQGGNIPSLLNSLADAEKEKDEMLSQITQKQNKLQKVRKEMESFVADEKEIKDLFKKIFVDHEYSKRQQMRIDLDERYSKGLSDKEEEQRNILNFDRGSLPKLEAQLARLKREYATDEKIEAKEKEILKLRKKLFAKEIKLDDDAEKCRIKLQSEIGKVIKRIKVFFFGFPENEMDFGSSHEHKKKLIPFHKKHSPEYFKGRGKLPPTEKKQNKIDNRFMGFLVEFTDMAKKNSAKLVVPYWKDTKQGIFLEWDSEHRTLSRQAHFGSKEDAETMKKDVYFEHAVHMATDYGLKKFKPFVSTQQHFDKRKKKDWTVRFFATPKNAKTYLNMFRTMDSGSRLEYLVQQLVKMGSDAHNAKGKGKQSLIDSMNMFSFKKGILFVTVGSGSKTKDVEIGEVEGFDKTHTGKAIDLFADLKIDFVNPLEEVAEKLGDVFAEREFKAKNKNPNEIN